MFVFYLFELEVLRTQGLLDLLVGSPGRRLHGTAEAVQHPFERELLHFSSSYRLSEPATAATRPRGCVSTRDDRWLVITIEFSLCDSRNSSGLNAQCSYHNMTLADATRPLCALPPCPAAELLATFGRILAKAYRFAVRCQNSSTSRALSRSCAQQPADASAVVLLFPIHRSSPLRHGPVTCGRNGVLPLWNKARKTTNIQNVS